MDTATFFFNGKKIVSLEVPSQQDGGIQRLLRRVHYEHGVSNPDYEVSRDWDKARAFNDPIIDLKNADLGKF